MALIILQINSIHRDKISINLLKTFLLDYLFLSVDFSFLKSQRLIDSLFLWILLICKNVSLKEILSTWFFSL